MWVLEDQTEKENKMQKICIPKDEFQQRIDKIKEYMTKEQLDVILVYGDEYRK